MIALHKVSKSYSGRQVLQGVDWSVGKGEFWGILGPNGSGKSTLLQLIAGNLRPDAGRIELDGQWIADYGRKALARKVAVLEQDGLPPVSFTVQEVLEMGRFPYLNWLGMELTSSPESLLPSIMERLDLIELANRPLQSLSGGQRQRAALGKVMVQQPEIVLLDEPTTFLDIHYQVEFMELISAWRRDSELTVVAALHDLNLAALYCDRLLVLKGGYIEASGEPQEVLNAELLRKVFGVETAVLSHPDHGTPQFLLRPPGTSVK
jgi:iron complex transport system ATP-binding protein